MTTRLMWPHSEFDRDKKNEATYSAHGELAPTRPTLSQLWSFKIRRATFSNYSKISPISWLWCFDIAKGPVGELF